MVVVPAALLGALTSADFLFVPLSVIAAAVVAEFAAVVESAL